MILKCAECEWFGLPGEDVVRWMCPKCCGRLRVADRQEVER